jgi:hypothetical protein
MSAYTVVRNPSSRRHANWEARSRAGLAMHFKLGATAQLVEFRERGEHSVFQLVFIGFGVGVGLSGSASANFVPPHTFVADTARIVGSAFVEAGRQLAGQRPRNIEQPDWEAQISAWTPLKCASAFSAVDLNRAFGRVTAAGAGLGLGYGQTIITAFKLGQNFFESQELSSMKALGRDVPVGGAVVAGASANSNAGMWFLLDD